SGVGIVLGRPPRTRRITQPLDAVDGKRLPPLTDRNRGDLQRGGYLLVVRPVRRSQDNAAAQSQRLRCRGATDELVECATSLSGECNGKRDTGPRPTVPEVHYTIKNYPYDVLVDLLEARGGIGPPIEVLQTSALPLGDRAVVLYAKNPRAARGRQILERETGFE